MLFKAALLLVFLSFTLIDSAVSASIPHTPSKEPRVPSADQFLPGLQIRKLDCNTKEPAVTKAVANDTLYQFCTDHLGVNIAQGNNYSTHYDTNNMRLDFNVINQCAPNGVYLPWDTCVDGFTRGADCMAECGKEFTAGGQTTVDCIGFDLSVSS